MSLALLVLTVSAPITQVTVYGDRARVVRTAHVALSGHERIELPLLPEAVDPATIRVEAATADLERVDIEHVGASDFPQAKARELLLALDTLDDQLSRARGQRAAYAAPLQVLRELSPTEPAAGALRPPPRLDASGWGAALAFARSYGDRMQGKLRELDRTVADLEQKRRTLVAEALLYGGTKQQSGHRVVAFVAGHGKAQIRLAYFVGGAKWQPAYELRLDPRSSQLEVRLFGMVSQETTEDWVDAQLTLSTAIPATATQFPKLVTWKIGERERFVPTPVVNVPASTPAPQPAPPPPPKPAPPPVAQEDKSKGSIEGVVRGSEDGRPLAGVTVVVQSAGGEQGDITNENGFYRISGLDPGRCVVRFFYANVKAERPNITVSASGSTTVSVALQTHAQTSETYTITEKAPTVDVGNTKTGATIERNYVVDGINATGRSFSGATSSENTYTQTFGLRPPPGYQPPSAALAGGWDLRFPVAGKDTVRSGRAARKVPLLARTWPVRVEREVFPALGPDGFLVGQLKNPSSQALPPGKATLFVGSDPAGEAQLGLVAPGESVVLPLGLDRAVRPIRNVKLVTTEKGVFSKDEINEYEVSIELASTYGTSLPVRIIDQIPLANQKDVEIRLLRTEPGAALDRPSGALEWRLAVPPAGKTRVSFSYSIKRPKGWVLHQ